jgi:hypothetical protein
MLVVMQDAQLGGVEGGDPSGHTRGLAMFGVSAIVGCSALAHVVAVRWFDGPWITPDEFVYGLVGRSFWETGHLGLLGGGAPFYGLYPVLAGLPEAVFGTAVGLTVLQVIQALLASSAAAIVYMWARPAAGLRWALTAAVLTALLPAVLYSGLVMTEAMFLPVATLALWTIARALAHPTRSRQFVAVATLLLATSVRLQGVVMVPVLLSAIGLMSCFGRDPKLVRNLAPLLVTLGLLAAALLCFQLVRTGSASSSLGAYAVTASQGYDRVAAAKWAFWHLGDVFLLVLGAPFIAMLLLASESIKGGEPDPQVRAVVATTLSACFWLPLQVGVFASRFVGQLAERDLIALAPPLLVCFAIWLTRGLPRPQPLTSIVATFAAVTALLLPVRTLVTAAASPDAFMTIPLWRIYERVSGGTFELAWVTAVTVIVVLTVLIPRRAAVLLPSLIAGIFVITSILTVHEIEYRTQFVRTQFFGTASKSWVNDAATGPVTYVYDGNPFWNAVWEYAYWNDRIRWIAKLPSPTPGPLPNASSARADNDGLVVDDKGRSFPSHYVLASTVFTFIGKVVAEVRQSGLDQAGLRLWRTPGAPRLATAMTGLRSNGDISEPVHITVYGCRPGRLELTLVSKEQTPLLVDIDGKPAAHIALTPGKIWKGSVPAPPQANGNRRCVYGLSSPGLVSSTRIKFVPR